MNIDLGVKDILDEDEYYPLVSIIIPVYNVEKYIFETLISVQKQSFTNWECICIDDCSTDMSIKQVRKICKIDNRFKLVELKKNCGAALARNAGIEAARGTYLAFLDADDIWKEDKLSVQLDYMIRNEYDFTCTSYGKINESSEVLKKTCNVEMRYTYYDLLRKCPGNSTIIYNCRKLGKVYGPVIRRRNDFAMWLQVIKRTDAIYGISEVLSYHRIRDNSISSSKWKLIKYQFEVYNNIEKLGIIKSIYLTTYKIVQTLMMKNG